MNINKINELKSYLDGYEYKLDISKDIKLSIPLISIAFISKNADKIIERLKFNNYLNLKITEDYTVSEFTKDKNNGMIFFATTKNEIFKTYSRKPLTKYTIHSFYDNYISLMNNFKTKEKEINNESINWPKFDNNETFTNEFFKELKLRNNNNRKSFFKEKIDNTFNFNNVIEERIDSIKKVLLSKGEEYSVDNNRFYNFEEAGKIKNESPEKALFGMQAKHIVSVKKIIDDIENKNEYPSLELLNEKIGDTINYYILLEGLIKSKM